MKVVLLLAGKGRRLGKLTENKHKAFTLLQGEPLLKHLLVRLMRAGMTKLVPVLGFDKDALYEYVKKICDGNVEIIFVENKDYSKTNNLGSLLCARPVVEDESFIVCNGDLVINGDIIKDIIESEYLSAIVGDDSKHSEPIDSPILEIIDNRIYDLGRHISFEKSGGYAIGLYKFGKDLSSVFFDIAQNVFEKNNNSGFHDPLIKLFKDFPVYICSTKERLWMDIDTKEDILLANNILKKIIKEEMLFRS